MQAPPVISDWNSPPDSGRLLSGATQNEHYTRASVFVNGEQSIAERAKADELSSTSNSNEMFALRDFIPVLDDPDQLIEQTGRRDSSSLMLELLEYYQQAQSSSSNEPSMLNQSQYSPDQTSLDRSIEPDHRQSQQSDSWFGLALDQAQSSSILPTQSHEQQQQTHQHQPDLHQQPALASHLFTADTQPQPQRPPSPPQQHQQARQEFPYYPYPSATCSQGQLNSESNEGYYRNHQQSSYDQSLGETLHMFEREPVVQQPVVDQSHLDCISSQTVHLFEAYRLNPSAHFDQSSCNGPIYCDELPDFQNLQTEQPFSHFPDRTEESLISNSVIVETNNCSPSRHQASTVVEQPRESYSEGYAPTRYDQSTLYQSQLCQPTETVNDCMSQTNYQVASESDYTELVFRTQQDNTSSAVVYDEFEHDEFSNKTYHLLDTQTANRQTAEPVTGTNCIYSAENFSNNQMLASQHDQYQLPQTTGECSTINHDGPIPRVSRFYDPTLEIRTDLEPDEDSSEEQSLASSPRCRYGSNKMARSPGCSQSTLKKLRAFLERRIQNKERNSLESSNSAGSSRSSISSASSSTTTSDSSSKFTRLGQTYPTNPLNESTSSQSASSIEWNLRSSSLSTSSNSRHISRDHMMRPNSQQDDYITVVDKMSTDKDSNHIETNGKASRMSAYAIETRSSKRRWNHQSETNNSSKDFLQNDESMSNESVEILHTRSTRLRSGSSLNQDESTIRT